MTLNGGGRGTCADKDNFVQLATGNPRNMQNSVATDAPKNVRNRVIKL